MAGDIAKEREAIEGKIAAKGITAADRIMTDGTRNESIYDRYIPGILPPEPEEGCKWWFVFREGMLLVRVLGDKAEVPLEKDCMAMGMEIARSQYLGVFDGHSCYSAEAVNGYNEDAPVDWAYAKGNAGSETDINASGQTSKEKLEFRDYRSLYGMLDHDVFMLAGRAKQIVDWDRNHQFCGRCGARTVTKKEERAKLCPECGFLSFPRISPAVITAIIKEDEILLAHGRNFKEGMYSLIAGFVEPGETLEECVAREIREEVGISVRNIRYFKSQPWPFPDSLMIGFVADYAGGEINVDGVEITDAGWYSKDRLPGLPSGMSVARKIIEWYRENY